VLYSERIPHIVHRHALLLRAPGRARLLANVLERFVQPDPTTRQRRGEGDGREGVSGSACVHGMPGWGKTTARFSESALFELSGELLGKLTEIRDLLVALASRRAGFQGVMGGCAANSPEKAAQRGQQASRRGGGWLA